MSEPPSKPQPTPRDQAPAGPEKRLIGGATIKELEKRDRELRNRAARAERLGLALRVVTVLVLVAAVALFGNSWNQLGGAHLAAAYSLKAIRMELDTQLTEVLLYAPLQEKAERKTRKDLGAARAELVSPDLRIQVRGIGTVRRLLAQRWPRAKARVRTELEPLYEDYVSRYETAETAVRERTRQYNAAAKQYNQAVKPFPASAIRKLRGYPEQLPTLK